MIKETKEGLITRLAVLFVVIFCLLFLAVFYHLARKVNASDTVGTIDDVFKYAKGVDDPSIKINFGLFQGEINVHVTDTNLSGFAWGEKIGWVNLAPTGGGVLNDGEGKLSGKATSEFGGMIDFSQVTIDSIGEFLGYAVSDKFGKIIFNCVTNNSCAIDNFKVVTDWRPRSTRKDTTPIVLPTTDTTPNTNEEPPVASIPKPKPLPVVNTGQYEGGGDVVKNNTSQDIVNGGITNIAPGSNPVVDNINTNSIQNQPSSDKYNSDKNTKTIISVVENTTNEIRKDVIIVAKEKVVDISTKTVTTVGVAGGGTVIVSSLATSLVSFSEFFLTLFRLWSIILSALGLRKRREPWGIVYDSITKEPIDPAYVILKDKFGKEVATSITDIDGRFGFLVQPGVYRLQVKKTNFIFPSVKLHGKEKDELYDNLYFGEDIILRDNKLININIPMDPEHFDWNQFAKKQKKLTKLSSLFFRVTRQIARALFFIGTIFAIGLFLVKPDGFNIAILIIYIVLLILRTTNKKVKSYGTISDKNTGLPFSFAIVRVFLGDLKKEIFHRVTDKNGHYYCLLTKGNYYITIEKKNNDESYSKIYTSEVMSLKNGVLNQDFKII